MNPKILARMLLEEVSVPGAETPTASAKDFIMAVNRKQWDEYTKLPPEFKRSKYGWELEYKNWKFQVYFYPDGKTLWSAYYKTPAFSWSSSKEQRQDWAWSGDNEIEELPPKANYKAYTNRLKRMADKHPDVWRKRYIPSMPDPHSIGSYGY